MHETNEAVEAVEEKSGSEDAWEGETEEVVSDEDGEEAVIKRTFGRRGEGL
jgi:hypothetical protein